MTWQCLDFSGSIVDVARCPFIQNNAEPCVVPCPGQCAYATQWSPWSGCGSVCNERNVRERRTLAVIGAGSDDTCETQVEQRDCPMDGCFITMWRVSPWGECAPLNMERTRIGDMCLRGIRSRGVECVRLKEPTFESFELMDDAACPIEYKAIATQTCSIRCDFNCQVSQWGEWGPCCPTGQSQRARAILRHPAESGKRCPNVTVLNFSRPFSIKCRFKTFEKILTLALSPQRNAQMHQPM